MRLDRILRAAIASMIHGRHTPHCYRAHVLGKGYVNDGSAVYDRKEYLRQLERDATSEVENMGYARKYGEPGYTQPAKGVLFANWNKFPSGLDTLLERAGYAIEWSDEWTVCDDCQRAVRTQPDGYDWRPVYSMVDDCTLLCRDCVQAENPVSEEE